MSRLAGWDGIQAENEGWFIFEFEATAMEICAYARSNFQKSQSYKHYKNGDLAALAFVQQRAAEGSAYHIDALARTQLL